MAEDFYVYGLKCNCHPERGVRYVGITGAGAGVRLRDHLKNSRKPDSDRIGGLPVYRWMRKHGADNIRMSLLETCETQDQLNEREVFWIRELGTFAPGGMNMTLGGGGKRGYRHSEETKNRISALKRGKPGFSKSGLSVADVHEIKKRLWGGETAAGLAETYQVSRKTLKDISQGNTWNHVPWPIGPRQKARTSERLRDAIEKRGRGPDGRLEKAQ